MGKRLIILNQQPHVPSFMLAAITAAEGFYDEIFYVNPRCPDNTDAVGREARVHFLHPSVLRRAISCPRALFSLFNPVVFSDLIQCIKDRKKLFRLLPQLLAEQRIHHRIAPVARRLVRNAAEMSEVVLFSVWLDACAYTAAVLKRRFPMVKALSLAHSYEVLAARNPYIPYRHIRFKHRYLDGVFFISYAVMRNYFPKWEIGSPYIGKNAMSAIWVPTGMTTGGTLWMNLFSTSAPVHGRFRLKDLIS